MSLHPAFVEYMDGARLYLELEIDKDNASIREVKMHFCDFIRIMIKNFSRKCIFYFIFFQKSLVLFMTCLSLSLLLLLSLLDIFVHYIILHHFALQRKLFYFYYYSQKNPYEVNSWEMHLIIYIISLVVNI